MATEDELRGLSFWQRSSFATCEAWHKEVRAQNLPDMMAAIAKLSGRKPRYSVVHYWHFALPTTLLAAHLILWKPETRPPIASQPHA
jgi:hypothetical protein